MTTHTLLLCGVTLSLAGGGGDQARAQGSRCWGAPDTRAWLSSPAAVNSRTLQQPGPQHRGPLLPQLSCTQVEWRPCGLLLGTVPRVATEKQRQASCTDRPHLSVPGSLLLLVWTPSWTCFCKIRGGYKQNPNLTLVTGVCRGWDIALSIGPQWWHSAVRTLSGPLPLAPGTRSSQSLSQRQLS